LAPKEILEKYSLLVKIGPEEFRNFVEEFLKQKSIPIFLE